MPQDNRRRTGPPNHNTRTELRLLHLNCQGFRTAKPDIQTLLHEHSPDIVSIQETLITLPFYFRGYTAYHSFKTRDLRGTTLLIKSDITSERITDLPPDYPPDSITADLHLPNQRPLRVITTYCSPSGPGLPAAFLQRELTAKPNTIVMGDLNARCFIHGSTYQNQNGYRLQQLYDDQLLYSTNPGQPTRIDPRGYDDSTLDFILCTALNLPKLSDLEILDPVTSDHLPITATLQVTGHTVPDNYTPKPRFDAANWDSYKQDIESKIPNAPTIHADKDSIDLAIRFITESIQKADTDNIPRTKNDSHRPPLPPFILSQIKERRQLQKTYKRTRDRQVKRQINRLTKTIDINIKEYREKTINNAWTNQPNKKPNDFWPTVRRLMKKPQQSSTVPLHKNGNVYKTTKERLDCFRDLYQDIFSEPPPRPGTEDFNVQVKDYIRNLATRPNDITEFKTRVTAEDILKSLKRTKNTAPGTDGIYYSHIKNLPLNALDYLADIYEASMDANYFPDLWKKGTTILIPKPNKDHKDPKNYRPITLLPALGKTFERIINNRLKTHLEKNGKLNQDQSGYRAGRSTTDAITNLLQFSKSALTRGRKVLAAFYDVEKAFDKVWHDGLVYKLGNVSNLSDGLTKLIQSFLTDRTTCFRLDGTYSDELQLPAGTPQGSILSPTLFILYVNDIPPMTNPKQGNQEQYADDLTAYKDGQHFFIARDRLQPHHDKIEKWSDIWRSSFNAAKTNVLPMQRRGQYIDPAAYLIVKGTRVEASKKVTNLGVRMDHRLTMSDHFNYVYKRANDRVNLLKAIAGSYDHPRAPTKLTLRIYNAMVRPIMEYAPTACILFNDTQFDKLENLRTRAHRIAHGFPSWVNKNWTRDLMNDATPKRRIEDLCIKYISSDKRAPRLKKTIRHIQDNYPNYSTRNGLKNTPLALAYTAKMTRQQQNN